MSTTEQRYFVKPEHNAKNESEHLHKNITDETKVASAHSIGLHTKHYIPNPTQRMKKIHWNPIKSDQNIQDSIWHKIDHEWRDYNPKIFSLKFQIRQNKPKLNKKTLKKEVITEAQMNDTKTVQFVESQRSKHVQIGLKSFAMTNKELRDIILTLDETKMSSDKIQCLLHICPKPWEQLQAERMSLDIKPKMFGITERFFYSLSDIIELKQRLQKWIFKLEFEETIREITQQITVIEKAKLAITLSKDLLQIFSILLAFGNHMNYNNRRNSNAYGFDISDLTLLSQIRTFDNSMTFPMYLYSFIEQKYPVLLGIIDQFEIVHRAAQISAETIYTQYNVLVSETNDLDSMIDRHKMEYFDILSEKDLFICKMVNFQKIVKDKMWRFESKLESLRKCETELMKYFATKIGIEQILQNISMFIQMLAESKLTLKERALFAEKKRMKRKRSKKPPPITRSNTASLTRNCMQKYAPKQNNPRQYSLALEDIGTPLADTNPGSILYLFDEKKDKKESIPKSKPQLMSSNSACLFSNSMPNAQSKNIITFHYSEQNNNDCESESDSSDFEFLDESVSDSRGNCHDSELTENPLSDTQKSSAVSSLKLKIDSKYNIMQRRRNSDPTPTPTPSTPKLDMSARKSTNKKINNTLLARINMFECKSNDSSFAVMSAQSRSTPVSDRYNCTVNASDGFGAIVTRNTSQSVHVSVKRKNNTKKSVKKRRITRTFSNQFIANARQSK